MFKKVLSITTLALLLTLTTLTPNASAQMPAGDNPMGGPGFSDDSGPGMRMGHKGKMGPMNHQGGGPGDMMKVLKELNLTEAQKNELKASRESAKGKIQGIRGQLQTEREKLMDLMFDPNASKDSMLAQQQKVASLKNQMEVIRIENIATLKEILTPEQKEKLSSVASQKRTMMKERREQFKQKREQFKQNRQSFNKSEN